MHGPGMPEAKPSVVIIDDDAEFRDSVVRLLRSVGLDIQQFSSVADFSKAKLSDGPTCLVLDVRMPGRSGLELQRDLATANRQVPIIFITARVIRPWVHSGSVSKPSAPVSVRSWFGSRLVA